MSRDLGPTELRVCRMVFAFLGVMVFAFLLFTAIESLSNPSPPVRKVQIQPDITNATDRNPKQPRQSSPPIQTLGAQSQKDPVRGAVPDDPARVSLSNKKVRSEPPEATALERAIRFDPRPLEQRLDGKSLVLADDVPKSTSTETFQPRQQGTIVTATFATAEPPSLDPPQEVKPLPQRLAPTTQREPKEPSLRAASLTYEHVQQIQSRLRELGFLSSTNSDAWDATSRDALRDFKLVNRLANDDIWDLRTSEKLNSQTAVRADRSFIGSWSTAPCRSARTKNLRLSINTRGARSSTGSVCEFRDFESDDRGWRVRATCSQGNQRWSADGKFTLTANKLVWTSERDIVSYFRCN
jgi:hypothetical protein